MQQAELGDIVYVEMPEVGSQMESGAVFGVVESVKVHSKSRTTSSDQTQGRFTQGF